MDEKRWWWVVSFLYGNDNPSLGEYKCAINRSELSIDMYDLFKDEIAKIAKSPKDKIVLLSVINFGEYKETKNA